MTNTHRHALGPPIHVASPPTSNGLSVPVAEPKMLSVLPTRPRDVIGYVSASRVACTVNVFDFVEPTPSRAKNSATPVVASPVSAVMMPKKRLVNPMIRPRRYRSASHPIGSAPRMRNADEAETMKMIAPSLSPSESRMSGDNVPIVAASRLSTATIAASVAKVTPPPRASAWRNVIAPSPMPGITSSPASRPSAIDC